MGQSQLKSVIGKLKRRAPVYDLMGVDIVPLQNKYKMRGRRYIFVLARLYNPQPAASAFSGMRAIVGKEKSSRKIFKG